MYSTQGITYEDVEKPFNICDECVHMQWREFKNTCQPYCTFHGKNVSADDSCTKFVREDNVE